MKIYDKKDDLIWEWQAFLMGVFSIFRKAMFQEKIKSKNIIDHNHNKVKHLEINMNLKESLSN